ncbi:MAG: hypothetical protein R2729_04070 [Bryobacteraceae bacterium]
MLATAAFLSARTTLEACGSRRKRKTQTRVEGDVVGFEMGFMGAGDNSDASAGEKNLFAFTPDGQLKFKLKLSEAQVGIPPR